VALQGSATSGVYKAFVGSEEPHQEGTKPASGEAGVLVTSTVPVWAVLEDLRTDDEQIFFGAFV
jgi:hypothetical protein